MSDVDFSQFVRENRDWGAGTTSEAARGGTDRFGAVDPSTAEGWSGSAPDPSAEPSPRPRGRRRKPEPRGDEEFQADSTELPRPRGRRHRPDSSRPEQPAEPANAGEPPRGRRHRRGADEEPPDPGSREFTSPGAGEPDTGSLEELGLAGTDDEEDEEAAPARPGRRSGRSAPSGRRARRGSGTKRARKRRGRRFAPVAALLALLLFVGAAGGGAYWWLRTYVVPPDYEGRGTGQVEIVVEDGHTGADVADTLVDAGVVASARAFTNALRGLDSSDIRPGTYELRSQMSGEAAAERLFDPDALIATQVTLPEGLRASQIYERVAEQTDLTVAELEDAAQEPEELGLPDYADGEIEGYLFPDTYTVDPDVSADVLLGRMIDRFDDTAEDIGLEERATERDLDPQEVMAIAAIVQAESGSAEDMRKVARVVYNRLDIGMELGMDSTCFYVIDDYGIALTAEQLRECDEADSEYATYGREGIPAGPIVSPGQVAMEAALDPADGEWLFFVTTDPEEGYTQFAETEEEFLELKEEFNQNRGAQ
ncbi:endolytic transglycosylase MltG [Lipingzhangella sp. LS1_29]|uniref:Endolytic murein transglycosylase n=1 Tax=Lipingzhangella rawalii TaxID=2055835 RepID=A0ABU2H943_9ACTN|nr:endolytic transglycosylase MltG [Lipingzhangella rawalii]MDS1271374.1 endolytic transglycosylase MltG [Lipingzhangella rawalii]